MSISNCDIVIKAEFLANQPKNYNFILLDKRGLKLNNPFGHRQGKHHKDEQIHYTDSFWCGKSMQLSLPDETLFAALVLVLSQ